MQGLTHCKVFKKDKISFARFIPITTPIKSIFSIFENAAINHKYLIYCFLIYNILKFYVLFYFVPQNYLRREESYIM